MRSSSSVAQSTLGPKARQALRAVPAQQAEITLAERLLQGPLTLAFALQSAADVAIALRQLHAQGKTHGKVSAETVLLRESSAHLAPGPGEESERHDVKSFGIVLLQLLRGLDSPSEHSAMSVDQLAASATELAQRCVAGDEATDMRKVVVELRVLALLARQRMAQPVPSEAEPAPEPPAQPAAAIQPIAVAASAPAIVPEFNLEPVRDLPPSEESCPKCGSRYVYASKPRTWRESLGTSFGMSLRRCHRCYHRYLKLFGRKDARNTTGE